MSDDDFPNLLSKAVGGAVAAVIFVGFGLDVPTALGYAVAWLVGSVAIDAAGVYVGDYADNAVLGTFVLLLIAAVSVPDPWLPLTVVGGLVGGWFLFDGVQHLRHGVTRDEVTHPYSHDGGPVTGLARALGARLLEPFRL